MFLSPVLTRGLGRWMGRGYLSHGTWLWPCFQVPGHPRPHQWGQVSVSPQDVPGSRAVIPGWDQSMSLHPSARFPASSIPGGSVLHPTEQMSLCRLQELGSQVTLKPFLGELCSMRNRTFLKMPSEDDK